MKYEVLNEAYKNVTLFDKAEGLGFECHIIWDERWMELAYPYSKCYGENTTIHPVKGLRQGVGAHYNHQGILKENDSVLEETIQIFTNEVDDILKNNKKVFLWIHLPHVLNGRVCYGGDIDAFDRCIGLLRERFSDNNIFITADHGNMNGHKGKICYGFDVNEIAIRIPMITPRLSIGDVCSTVCSNVDLYDIIFERKIVEREYVFSDSAYYAQPHRKLAVIMGKYKYIYNKQDSTEELYDVEWDINENFNLINDKVFDVDRKVDTNIREVYFYTDWDKLPEIRQRARDIKNSIWRDLSKKAKLRQKLRAIRKKYFRRTAKKK